MVRLLNGNKIDRSFKWQLVLHRLSFIEFCIEATNAPEEGDIISLDQEGERFLKTYEVCSATPAGMLYCLRAKGKDLIRRENDEIYAS
jgi:hypothetical protein